MPAPSLARLAQEILPLAHDVDVRVLPGDQLLVRKGMVENPQVEAGLKAPREIPGEVGYELYVAVRPPGAERRITQQVRPDESFAVGGAPAPLRLDEDAEGAEWTVPRPGRGPVTVRVRRGPRAPVAEINAILAVIDQGVGR